MQPEVLLAFRDESGAWREVTVASRRFTIGSGTGNDLRVDAPGVSRRHAVIETHEGGVFVYDCQSEQGTSLNNAPLRGSAQLRGGDLLTLGGSYDITVKLRGQSPARTRDDARPRPAPAPPRAASESAARYAALPPRTRPPATRTHEDESSSVLKYAAVAAGVLILVVIGFFLVAGRRTSQLDGRGGEERRPDPPSSQAETSKQGAVDAPATQGDATATSAAEFERAAARAVQRVSGDDRPYAVPPEALRDINQQVEQYRQSNSLRDAFAAMQREARPIAAQARAASVPPGLVFYAALAESEGGRDPSAAARRMIPQLRELRVTLGGEDAEGALLVLAAYTYGVGSKKSHPLLNTIRRLVRDPYAERNVWHLRRRGGLSDAAYNLVIRTLAVAVIAQDPRRYGVPAGPLIY